MTTAARTEVLREPARALPHRQCVVDPACLLRAEHLLLLGVWQALGHSFGVLFVPFTTTMSRLWDMLQSGPLAAGAVGVGETLRRHARHQYRARGHASVSLLARIKLIAAAFEPYIYILYATPTISLVPFVSVMFGFEFGSRVLVSVLISIFPILIGVTEGARSIPRQHLDVAAIFGSNEGQLWRDVIVPYVTPYAMIGHQAVDRAVDGRHAGRRVLPQSRRRGRGSAAGHHDRRLGLGARRHDFHLRDRGGAGRRRRTDRTISGAMATYSSRIEARRRRAGPGAAACITRERIAPVVAGAVLLVIWEIWVRSALPDFVARPSGIVMAIPSTIATAEFWSDVGATLGAILEGVAIGSAAGILIGVAMGRVREIDWFLSTYIRALYALPLIALVPIVILWVGYQPAARLMIVVISVFLPVAVTTADGTRAISKDYLDVGKMFGARTHNVWFGIALPSATPFIVAGIELGFARGITNAIAVEVLASVNGMGMSVFTKSNELNENASLVYVLCLAIFAVGVRSLMIRFRHWLAPWYHR